MSDEEQQEAVPTPAVSSSTAFRLGGDPPQVTRLSRKTLAVVGVIAGLGIGGSLIYALRPTGKQLGQEIYSTDGRAKADGLASVPKDYSQIPILGPPLPGDLGKPILAAQQNGKDVPLPPQGYRSNQQQADPAAAARQKAQQEREAARASQLFLGHGSTGGASGNSAETTVLPGLSMAAQPDLTATTPVPASGSAAKAAFLSRAGDRQTIATSTIERPVSNNVVLAGSIIPAALITGIRSDLPGQITAQVTQNVYDSPTGLTLLIPQGARLIGEYDSQIDTGQTRLLMAWTRLIFPDGKSLMLDRQPGADASGYAGLEDRVDNHWGGVARAAMISTLLGFGTELATGSDADIVRALRRGSQDTINQAGQQIVQRQLAIAPTLTIRPGHPLRVMVTRDLFLQPLGER